MPDSTVHVHIKHVRKAAALRLVSDSLRWEAIWEAKNRAMTASLAQEAFDKQVQQTKAVAQDLGLCRGNLLLVQGQLEERDQKIRKLRPWATSAKFGGVGIVLAVILAVINSFTNALTP